MQEWFYFGCGAVSGHYLFTESRSRPDRNPMTQRLMSFDKDLAPAFNQNLLYQAALSRLGALRYSAISWWDQSVDTRPGSNSIIFSPGMSASKEDILFEAKRRFPWVFQRLPREVVWWQPESSSP